MTAIWLNVWNNNMLSSDVLISDTTWHIIVLSVHIITCVNMI
ncbi:hypothetical protein [Candidatus Hodgkinia cicadicola]